MTGPEPAEGRRPRFSSPGRDRPGRQGRGRPAQKMSRAVPKKGLTAANCLPCQANLVSCRALTGDSASP